LNCFHVVWFLFDQTSGSEDANGMTLALAERERNQKVRGDLPLEGRIEDLANSLDVILECRLTKSGIVD